MHVNVSQFLNELQWKLDTLLGNSFLFSRQKKIYVGSNSNKCAFFSPKYQIGNGNPILQKAIKRIFIEFTSEKPPQKQLWGI